MHYKKKKEKKENIKEYLFVEGHVTVAKWPLCYYSIFFFVCLFCFCYFFIMNKKTTCSFA